MNNSNLAVAETQEPSPISIYSSGKHHRMHAKTINPYAAFLVGKMIDVAAHVENSENVYWFYADDSDKVIFAIRQSDNLVHLALNEIGMGQHYWEHYYYNLGKRLVAELVAAVEAKQAVAPIQGITVTSLAIVPKPAPVCPSASREARTTFEQGTFSFDVLHSDIDRRVWQSNVNAATYCMEVKAEVHENTVTTTSLINGRVISTQQWKISIHMAMKYSWLGYLPTVQDAIAGAYEHLQALVLSGKA